MKVDGSVDSTQGSPLTSDLYTHTRSHRTGLEKRTFGGLCVCLLPAVPSKNLQENPVILFCYFLRSPTPLAHLPHTPT